MYQLNLVLHTCSVCISLWHMTIDSCLAPCVWKWSETGKQNMNMHVSWKPGNLHLCNYVQQNNTYSYYINYLYLVCALLFLIYRQINGITLFVFSILKLTNLSKDLPVRFFPEATLIGKTSIIYIYIFCVAECLICLSLFVHISRALLAECACQEARGN